MCEEDEQSYIVTESTNPGNGYICTSHRLHMWVWVLWMDNATHPPKKRIWKCFKAMNWNMKNLGVHLHFLIHNFSLWKRSAPLESRIFCLWTLGFGFYHVWVFVFIFKALGWVVSAGYSGHSGQLHVFDLPPPQYWSLSAWMASLGWALAAVGSYVVKCIVDTRGRCVLRSQPGQGRDIHPLQPCLG